MKRRHLLAVVVVGFALTAATAPANAAWSMRQVHASCYGPGLYGNSTANGTVLTTRTEGIAHKRIPLGTPTILASGRKATFAKVIDRGPFIAGREVDVTAATARRLGYPSCRAFGVRTVSMWSSNR